MGRPKTELRRSMNRNSSNRAGLDETGDEILTVIAFWFTWTAFHPETDVLEAS